MSLALIAILMIFAPLLGGVTAGLTSAKINVKIAQILTTSLTFLSAICAWAIFLKLPAAGAPIHLTLLEWFNTGAFKANWSVYIDMLTATMLIVVTTVSAVVHLYSIGYMADDPHIPRFMSYLSLFTFCMLMLVSSDNFAQLFFGWEGVGVCSYLLIGFWFNKNSANAAAIKAFLVNRVGDFGFALGIFAIYWNFNSIEFATVFAKVPELANSTISFFGYEVNLITFCCLLLFMGAMGKSAQLGLHTWLPDAMEGPTPVSALIHAATMVTAGVFMVARCSPLFEYSSTALAFVTVVGAVTCLFAATVALVQNDIKKIIAYSTCSQLGYMFFACGVSAYAAGVFHLMTHGFFKALLFLGAGSVIHAMHHEQDIRKMGGIWKLIPITYALMWIGSLALGGIYPFAGFYSKDIILESAYASGTTFGQFAYWMGIVAATLTAFYSWRLLILTFHGKTRADEETISHAHESPITMLLPLFILAVGSLGAGYYGAVELGMVNSSLDYWAGAIKVLPANNSLESAHHVEKWVALLPLAVGVVGIALAYYLYLFKTNIPGLISRRFSLGYRLLDHKWYFDEMYDFAFVRSAKSMGRNLWLIVDTKIVDSIPNGAAYISSRFAKFVSMLQSGFVYNYAFVMLLGLLVLLTWVMF